MINTRICLSMATLGLLALTACHADAPGTYRLAQYGIRPDTEANCAPAFAEALAKIAASRTEGDTITLLLEPGRYNFYPEGAAQRTYFISNHDQDNPKLVGIDLEGVSNVILDGQGAELIFHGRMLPVALTKSQNVTLKNFAIDFATPHIAQVEIVDNDTVGGIITYRPAPWVDYELRDSTFVHKGEGWELTPQSGIAFDGKTRHIVFNTSDIGVGVRRAWIADSAQNLIKAPWRNKKLTPGTVVAMRGWERPTPGIFLSHDKQTRIEEVTVHYAEGMGLLAQLCEDIDLQGFKVALRGENDPRYFTTQADATHFSGCKGTINSVGGLYEAMMDDAINVHGTYLKVMERRDDRTLVGRYMHEQSYGFDWGFAGDSVNFINSRVMEIIGEGNTVEAIKPLDTPTVEGAKLFEIRFAQPIDPAVDPEKGPFGIENLTWTPAVRFADNVVRNNRARGALFSTPRSVVAEQNLFDHTSGTAILLCGDCNGWFETGACHDVVIRGNKFVNALTNMFQFTNAVISIYPEIPDLAGQKHCFHSNIVIEDNEFDTFDAPILYAKSVCDLTFKGNVIKSNNEFPPFHWNRNRVLLEKAAGTFELNVVPEGETLTVESK